MGLSHFAESAQGYALTIRRLRSHSRLQEMLRAWSLKHSPVTRGWELPRMLLPRQQGIQWWAVRQGNRKTNQEKCHDLWETEKQNEARAAFSSPLNLRLIDQELCQTLPTTGQNRIIFKCSNIEANQSATQPHGAETVWRMDVIISV